MIDALNVMPYVEGEGRRDRLDLAGDAVDERAGAARRVVVLAFEPGPSHVGVHV